MSNPDLIKTIYSRATELQKKSLKAAIDEGEHRSSANDEYYRGGADALLDLVRELEAKSTEVPDKWRDKSGNKRHLIRSQIVTKSD